MPQSYIVWFDSEHTAMREKDSRVVPSTERFSLFSRREARDLKAKHEKQGNKVTLRLARPEELQWLRGGFRTGSDWNADGGASTSTTPERPTPKRNGSE